MFAEDAHSLMADSLSTLREALLDRGFNEPQAFSLVQTYFVMSLKASIYQDLPGDPLNPDDEDDEDNDFPGDMFFSEDDE